MPSGWRSGRTPPTGFAARTPTSAMRSNWRGNIGGSFSPESPRMSFWQRPVAFRSAPVRRFRNLLTGVDNVHPRGTRLGTDGKTYALSQQDAKRSTETDRYGAAVPERLAKAFDLREYHLRQPHSRPQVRRAVVRLPSMRRRRLSCLWKRWGADDGRIPSQPEGAAG